MKDLLNNLKGTASRRSGQYIWRRRYHHSPVQWGSSFVTITQPNGDIVGVGTDLDKSTGVTDLALAGYLSQ